MRWKPHVRFGERAGETDQPRSGHRAPARLNQSDGSDRHGPYECRVTLVS